MSLLPAHKPLFNTFAHTRRHAKKRARVAPETETARVVVEEGMKY
jgi:hypothetical protein